MKKEENQKQNWQTKKIRLKNKIKRRRRKREVR
jgi:hypothetical protein